MGKRRLEQALARLDSSKVEVEVEWSPFFLNPRLPDKAVDKRMMYDQKFGPEKVKQMIPRMTQVGKTVGINFSYGGKVGNTTLSHLLVELAGKQGKQDAMINKLFNLYFELEEDISDRTTLLKAAKEVGVVGAEETLAKRVGNNVVRAKVQQAYEQQISGVPHFIIDNKYGLGGAQEANTFVSVFKKLGYPLSPAL